MIKSIEVRIVDSLGSSPREIGARMFVSDKEIQGSIGGGRLEWEAIAHARALLAGEQKPQTTTFHLGPALGQCCGGKITLEFSENSPETLPPPSILIFGGGHIGAALSAALTPLHRKVTLYDDRPGYGTPTPIPEAVVRNAAPGSAFVITTHDHALDFLIAEEALARADARYIGMIGSATKRAALEAHLRQKSIDPAPLVCPIGATGLGDKRPEIIALHTAAEILQALRP